MTGPAGTVRASLRPGREAALEGTLRQATASGLTGQLWWTYARCPVLLALLYAVLRLLIDLLIIRGRPAADRDLELLVLRRTARRPHWRRADRMILAAFGRQLPANALLLVQPATILGWHRALVRRRWSAFGHRRGPGRP